jgi:transposase
MTAVPHGHWHSFTLVAALGYDQLTSPLLIDGPMNGEVFLTYVKKELAATLSAGDLVICDNLSSYKVSGVREAIESCGAQLFYLPAYSPDLNPLEMALAKLKNILPRTADGNEFINYQPAHEHKGTNGAPTWQVKPPIACSKPLGTRS